VLPRQGGWVGSRSTDNTNLSQMATELPPFTRPPPTGWWARVPAALRASTTRCSTHPVRNRPVDLRSRLLKGCGGRRWCGGWSCTRLFYAAAERQSTDAASHATRAPALNRPTCEHTCPLAKVAQRRLRSAARSPRPTCEHPCPLAKVAQRRLRSAARSPRLRHDTAQATTPYPHG
jgi:hypothetical protein